MEDCVTRREFEEYQHRLDDKKAAWDKDQDSVKQEIKDLRAELKEFRELTISVGKMAQTMEAMAKELEQQGKRLEAIENRDGENWRRIVTHVATTLVGAVLMYIFTRLGF